MATTRGPRGAQVLVGLDGSKGSLDALRAAIEQCKGPGSRLHIVHVIELPGTFGTGDGAAVWTSMLAAMQEAAREIVGLGVREAEGAKVDHRVRILEAHDAAAALVREAEEVGATLVVVGSHGRTGIRRILLGSVAERVVRLAHCPVLVVR